MEQQERGQRELQAPGQAVLLAVWGSLGPACFQEESLPWKAANVGRRGSCSKRKGRPPTEAQVKARIPARDLGTEG